jgi:transglutaminase-like putative cysteine protease
MKNSLLKFFAFLSFSLVFFSFFPIQKVYAADFDVKSDFTYSVNSQGIMHIKEVRSIRNNSSRFYIKSTSQETFIISAFKIRSETTREDVERILQTIKLYNSSGAELTPNTEIEGDQIIVTTSFGMSLNLGQEKQFILEYDNFELAEKVGNIWNIYVPGMSEDYNKTTTSANGATTQSSFTVTLELDEKLGEPNFILPEPLTSDVSGETRVYGFDSLTLINQSAWAQIGDKQYYSFTITQPVRSEDGIASRMFNIYYDLVLPRESASGNQEVYLESMSPEPEYIKEDGEGNIIARFLFSSKEEAKIVVKGFMTTSITDKVTRENAGDIGDIDLSQVYATVEDEEYTLKDLTEEATYWEVDSDEIQTKASELKGELTSVYDILIADYNFVTESVDYDNLKVGINNERQGALKTLQGGSSVCMEYSDLLITLLRAQGIPSRGAFGYGFDPKSGGTTEEGHQWVEAYVPNIGWIPIDPTWGDTGRKNYIGGDVDHALWRVASIDVDTPSPVTKYSLMEAGELDPPEFKIQAIESINTENLTSLEDLLGEYSYTQKQKLIEKVGQLNDYGKVAFLGVPGVVLLVLVIIVVVWGVRRISRRISN